MSPAFLIRINASLDYDASDDNTENIYEEIRDDKNATAARTDDDDAANNSGNSGSGNGNGSDGLKALFYRAKETVRRSSRQSVSGGNQDGGTYNSGGEQLSAFHMSISKGRKKNLMDRAAFDWDCGEGEGEGRKEEEGEGKSQQQDRVIKLDVEVSDP